MLISEDGPLFDRPEQEKMCMKILNFGSLNLDIVTRVEQFVRPGETVRARSQELRCGGKGLNQSIALARAGAEVWHAGCVGEGGEMLLNYLVDHGVHTDYIENILERQGSAFIQVTDTGDNSIILYPGSNECLTEAQVKDTLEHFGRGDILVLQNEVNLLPYIVDQAYRRGMIIVLNPSPYNEKIAAVDLNKISWLFVNEIEAEQIAGTREALVTWEKLHAQYPKLRLLVTLGAGGSVCFSGDYVNQQPPYPAEVKDTTGAGDTYTGYFLASLAGGKTLEEAMNIATMAAAISITRPGAAESIPGIEEVLACL